MIYPFEPFPSLADLNDELGTASVSYEIENPHISDRAHHEVLQPSVSINTEDALTGPLCLLNIPPTVQTNPINPFLQEQPEQQPFNKQSTLLKLIQSKDKLFFTSYSSPYSDHIEWKLIQVDFEYTLNNNPNAMQDGRMFVNFLICHPNDRQFNAPNQRFWPEYHELQGRFAVNSMYHLVKPSPNVSQYIRQKNLVNFSQWIHFSASTILHGPFNFAVLNG
jgi:hypothetical protein